VADVEPPAGSAPHVLVAAVDQPQLDDDSRHHLLKVRRLRPGDDLTVTDGHGRWRTCQLAGGGAIEPHGAIVTVPRPDPPITIAFALTKGDKPELVIQKLTELGVDRIVPFAAARSVVRWDPGKADAQHRRWLAIARTALEQSHRCWMPTVSGLATFADVVGLGATAVDRGGGPPSLTRSVLAVGPEGGWTTEERNALRDRVGLGPHVLRAETAALTAGGVMCSLRSGFVAERIIPDGRDPKGR
jgi:16S rRNA (uracil1498-N3)-methyltransferase